MPALLCIDLVGTQSRWRQGGVEPTQAAFEDFADLVLDTAGSIDVAPQMHGEIDGDWCGLRCPTPESALALGRRIFRRAWLESRSPQDSRLWLRGMVLPCDADEVVRRREADHELAGITRDSHSPAALEATMALRTGFDGMRLLVADVLLNDQLRGMFRIPLGRLGVIPFRRMNHTPYPPSLGRGYQDFLWMAETMQEWAHYTMRMKQRLLWSAQDREEFAHAAATQVVFHECDAILQSVTRRNIQRREDGHGVADGAEHGAGA
jgi:hypothetical protein